MSKAKQRRGSKPHQQRVGQQFNAEPEFKLLRNMGSSKYAGAARFIEVAPPGIQFRALANVDHITSITFANKIEKFEVPAEDADGETVEENRVIGFQIVVGIGGVQSEFTISNLEVAVGFYNDLIDSLDNVGIPLALKQRIVIPPPPPEPEPDLITGAGLLDADGNPIDAANEDSDDMPIIDELADLVEEIEVDKQAAEDEPLEH